MSQSVQGSTALSFTFSTQQLRAVLIDGEPWFCAADVCEALGYANARDAIAKHCRAGGVAKRDTPTSSGVQPLTFINEGNLYRLCIKSHKPEAQKFEAWVCDEVLPAIRKTGRYVAPAAQSETMHRAAEQIGAGDQQAIQRCIWFATRGFRFEQSWVQAVWFYLRQCLAMPSPARFTVDQLPRISRELARVLVITSQVEEITTHVEREAARRIFRKGEDAAVVLAELRQQATKRAAQLTDQKPLPEWLRADVLQVAQRTHDYVPGLHYQGPEQSDFFRNASQDQGASA